MQNLILETTEKLFSKHCTSTVRDEAEVGARSSIDRGRAGAGFITSCHGVAGKEPEPLAPRRRRSAA